LVLVSTQLSIESNKVKTIPYLFLDNIFLAKCNS
jgi:hypothetical protein